MPLEPRKVFVGGIPRSGVKSDDLKAHFARYGEVVDAVVMMNPDTGLCRGYGFVQFADDVGALKALDWKERDRHIFGGHRVSSSWLITAWWRQFFFFDALFAFGCSDGS
jgi:RNA-binding protein Musashi